MLQKIFQTGYGALANADTSEVSIDGCVPSHVWLLARHGTRYPSSQVKTLRSLLKNPETGDGSDEKSAAEDPRASDGKPQGRQR